MKVYVVSQAVSDDDGNFYSIVEGVYTDKTKAISKVKELHTEIVDCFENPEDDYEDGDVCFEIFEAEDSVICRSVDITEKEVE